MIKIIANWKMYLTIRQSRELAAQVNAWWQKAKCTNVELVLCPSDVALRDVADQMSGSNIKLGAQQVSLSQSLGAFTGQTSARQLREAGVSHVLLGHSEQRQFFHVTDAMVRQQFKLPLSTGCTQSSASGDRQNAIMAARIASLS